MTSSLSAKYKEQIENLKEDEAVIHVDFSENYKIKQQGEIKAAYYSQSTLAVYISTRMVRLQCRT